MNCIICPQTEILTFLRLGFFFFGTTPPFSSASSSPPVFRFLRTPFLRDLVLLLVAVLLAPEVFFMVILVADDLTVNLVLLATGMIFTLDGPAAVAAAAVPVGEGLGLTVVGLTAGVGVDVETTGAVPVASLSVAVAVAVLVAVLVGVPVVPSGFSDGIFSPAAVLVVDGIVPSTTEAALGGEVVVATALSVVVSTSTVVSAIAVEADEVLVTPALVGLSFLMEVVTAAATLTSVDSVSVSSLGGTEDATGTTDFSSLVSAATSVVASVVLVVVVLVVVVKVVNSPGSTSLFSLLPFVSTSIFVDGSVVSIIVVVG